jgi:hypothetical protein
VFEIELLAVVPAELNETIVRLAAMQVGEQRAHAATDQRIAVQGFAFEPGPGGMTVGKNLLADGLGDLLAVVTQQVDQRTPDFDIRLGDQRRGWSLGCH